MHRPFDLQQKISRLIAMSTYIDRLADDNNIGIIEFLKSHYPEKPITPKITLKSIHEATRVSRPKINGIINDLYDALLNLLCNKEVWEIQKHWVTIYIYKDGTYGAEDDSHILCITVSLPIIPKVGEIISFPLVDPGVFYNEGAVFDVQHEINSDMQHIIIKVDASDTDYSRWNKRFEQGKRNRYLQSHQQDIPQVSNSRRKRKKIHWPSND